MERLTHKTDMGWDAWEEILYSVSYDPEGCTCMDSSGRAHTGRK